MASCCLEASTFHRNIFVNYKYYPLNCHSTFMKFLAVTVLEVIKKDLISVKLPSISIEMTGFFQWLFLESLTKINVIGFFTSLYLFIFFTIALVYLVYVPVFVKAFIFQLLWMCNRIWNQVLWCFQQDSFSCDYLYIWHKTGNGHIEGVSY